MGKLNRVYGIIGVTALLMLAVTAVSVAAKVTNAGSPSQQSTRDPLVPCSEPNGVDDDASEPQDAADTDNIEEQCGQQDEADDANEKDDASEAADTIVPCSDPNGVDDEANRPKHAADTDNIEEQCGPQNEADWAEESDETRPTPRTLSLVLVRVSVEVFRNDATIRASTGAVLARWTI